MRPIASAAASLIPWLWFTGCADPLLAERAADVLTSDAAGPALDAAGPALDAAAPALDAAGLALDAAGPAGDGPDASTCDDTTPHGYVCHRKRDHDQEYAFVDGDDGTSLAAIRTQARVDRSDGPADAACPLGTPIMEDHCNDDGFLIEGYVPRPIFIPHLLFPLLPGGLEAEVPAGICGIYYWGAATIDCARACARANAAGTLCDQFGGTGGCCRAGTCGDGACACAQCD